MSEKKAGPPPIGPYEHSEVLSALRKTIKLGLKEEAIYWLNVIVTKAERGGPKMAAKQLWIMAAEDIDDQAVVMRAFAVFQMASAVQETDHLFFLVAQMCDAPKWWQTAAGREVDRLWSKAIGDLRTDPKPVPWYALDRHTRRGWDLRRKQDGQWNDDWSGTDEGRLKTTLHHFRGTDTGNEATRILDSDEEYQKVLLERRQLEGIRKRPGYEEEPPCLFDDEDGDV